MEKNGGSRLLQMKARFQQKQLQERELKIASVYEAQQARALDRVRHSPNGTAVSPPAPAPLMHHPGKVRQMFEERRTKAGIDKSYPLQPIQNTERAPRKALPNGYSKVTTSSSQRVTAERRTTKQFTSTHTVKKQQHKIENIVNGSGDLNHNHETDLNLEKRALPQSNGEPTVDVVDRADNNYLIENETFPDALAPAPTPRTPARAPPAAKAPPPRRSPPAKTTPVKAKPPAKVVTPPRRANENTGADSSAARGMQRTAQPVVKRHPLSSSSKRSVTSASPAPAPAEAAGPACAVCGRHFAPDRLARHQDICKKSHSKKRKPFDALKHRLAGTEAEPFIGKLRKGHAPSSTKVTKSLNNNWRQKHDEFIAAIRAAKQVQAHLNAGGKLSDLPPPPPSENPDYVQCPHCSRRFNQAAAERHIPKCSSFQHNKPKPPPRKR